MAIAAGCVQSRGLAGALVAAVAVSAGSDFVSTKGPLGVCPCEAGGIAIVAAVATVAVPRNPRRVGPDRSCDIACLPTSQAVARLRQKRAGLSVPPNNVVKIVESASR